jgi:hypothetical protein
MHTVRLFLINRPVHAASMVYTYVYGSQMFTEDSILQNARCYFVYFVIEITLSRRYFHQSPSAQTDSDHDQHIEIFNTCDFSDASIVEAVRLWRCDAGGRCSNPGRPMHTFLLLISILNSPDRVCLSAMS